MADKPSDLVQGTLDMLILKTLALEPMHGYAFTYVAGAAVGGVVNTYTTNANPVTPGTTGQRRFFSNQTGVIRYNQAAAATVADPPLQ
jgi:type IV pilus assembly protein PilA